jgi:hypothetical protein
MKVFNLIIVLLIMLSLLCACGGNGSDDGSSLQQEQGSTEGGTSDGYLIYDSELSLVQKEALEATTKTMNSLEVKGSEINWFSNIFEGYKSSDVGNYFNQRVNYAISESTDVDNRILVNPRSDNLVLPSGEIIILAVNYSWYLWFISKASEPDLVQFQINDQLLEIPSTRIGVIQIGAPFVELPSVARVTTLVHEARHSDCTEGALASDLNRFKNGLPPLNHLCSHTHEICPPEHPLAGEYACDSHPWGAYAIGALYAGAVALECTSCTESQKILAEQIFYDSVSRLLYNFTHLMDGSYGPPNMSSSDLVKED